MAPATFIEYIWVGNDSQLRSRTRVLDFVPSGAAEVPVITVDCASDGMHPCDHELFLKPRKLFPDPLRGDGGLLVLCDSHQVCQGAGKGGSPVAQPAKGNLRTTCEEVLHAVAPEEPVFSVEQEYGLEAPHSSSGPWLPFIGGLIDTSGPPFLSSSAKAEFEKEEAEERPRKRRSGVECCAGPHAQAGGMAKPLSQVGRRVAGRHMRACLDAGLAMTESCQRGTLLEETEWSYKLGPLAGLQAGDQLWLSRWLMQRVAEEEGVHVYFRDRQRCLFDFSTSKTRERGKGLAAIQQHIDCLQRAHLQHILAYTKGQLRSPSDINFNVGVGCRAAAISLPTCTLLQQCGPITDCRPAANADPYMVLTMLMATTLIQPASQALVSATRVHLLGKGNGGGEDKGCAADAVFDDDGCCLSESNSCSQGRSAVSAALTADSQEVLIDELERIDGFQPHDTCTLDDADGAFASEDWDECCSSAHSPCSSHDELVIAVERMDCCWAAKLRSSADCPPRFTA